MVKMATGVLKFIVDATTVRLTSHNQERCLQFTSLYIQNIISALRVLPHDQLEFKEDDLKKIFPCLKSSFTYAAKLLNLVLSNSSKPSPPPAEVCNLANDLLDLISSIESYLGSGHAACLFDAIKEWLPDFILALGSGHILSEVSRERSCSSASEHRNLYSSQWLTILAKVELCELSEVRQNEEAETVLEPPTFPIFKKLMDMVVLMLKGNPKVLDAVGVIFLAGSTVGLEKEDFELVLGLVHFVCAKLVRHENGEWEEHEVMLACLQKLYPQVERLAKDPRISEDSRHTLESARGLLEPVWMNYIYEDGGGSML